MTHETNDTHEIDFTPPKAVQQAAQRGLELKDEHAGKGLRDHTVAWARHLAEGKASEPAEAKRMRAYFRRHKVDKREGWDDPPTPGYVAWLLWGGDAGQQWAEELMRKVEAQGGEQAPMASAKHPPSERGAKAKPEPQAKKAPARRKKSGKNKPASKKKVAKKAVRKKAGRKAAPRRAKATSSRKASGRKKATVRKASGRKKATVRKASGRKKATVRKASGRKKTTVRKASGRKKTSVRKAASKAATGRTQKATTRAKKKTGARRGPGRPARR